MKKINWKMSRLITAILLLICVIICIAVKNGAVTSVFAVIGGLSLVGLIVSILMFAREKMLLEKEMNFTCKSCNKKFIWDESKIECTCLNLETNMTGNNTFYHYKVSVKWECDCGNKNEFVKILSTRNENCTSIISLVYKYYKGEILN